MGNSRFSHGHDLVADTVEDQFVHLLIHDNGSLKLNLSN